MEESIKLLRWGILSSEASINNSIVNKYECFTRQWKQEQPDLEPLGQQGGIQDAHSRTLKQSSSSYSAFFFHPHRAKFCGIL